MKTEVVITRKNKKSFELTIGNSQCTAMYTIGNSAVKTLYESLKSLIEKPTKEKKKRCKKLIDPEVVKERKREYARRYKAAHVKESRESARKSMLKALYMTKSCTLWMDGKAKFIDKNIVGIIRRLLEYKGDHNVEIRSVRDKLIMSNHDIVWFLKYLFEFKKFDRDTITEEQIEKALKDKGKGTIKFYEDSSKEEEQLILK